MDYYENEYQNERRNNMTAFIIAVMVFIITLIIAMSIVVNHHIGKGDEREKLKEIENGIKTKQNGTNETKNENGNETATIHTYHLGMRTSGLANVVFAY